jgi:hypothetical protein
MQVTIVQGMPWPTKGTLLPNRESDHRSHQSLMADLMFSRASHTAAMHPQTKQLPVPISTARSAVGGLKAPSDHSQR